jgi:AcrR family transcriptional regulator
MKAFERARSEEQKEVRIAAIISAAERLFDQHDYEAITLAAVAREASFTRSNLYKYFKTREEIFLQLLERDIGEWRHGLECALCQKDGRLTVSELAETWACQMNEHQRLMRLLSLLYLHLEKNAPLESLVEFKQVLIGELSSLIELLCARFSGLTPEAAEEFVAVAVATASGLYPMTHLSDKQKQAAQIAGFGCYDGRFASYYRNAVESALNGALDR